jgi:hypothetical protein
MALLRQDRVPDRKDAAMNSVETADAHPVSDAARAQAARRQLPERHDAVLCAREASETAVQPVWCVTFRWIVKRNVNIPLRAAARERG